MSLTPDEQVVREFLQPLRTVEPVRRGEGAADRVRRRWLVQAGELCAVALATVAVVAVVALLAHRSAATNAPSTPRHPSVFTFLSRGGIAEGLPSGGQSLHWLVPRPHIRAYGWSPDGLKVAYLADHQRAIARTEHAIEHVHHLDLGIRPPVFVSPLP